MNNDKLKLPDEIFQQGLDGFEAPYNEAAWEDMRNLLDKTDRKRPFLLWFRRNKKTTLTLITITMITTALISVWTLINTGTSPIAKTAITVHKSNGSVQKKNNLNHKNTQNKDNIFYGEEKENVGYFLQSGTGKNTTGSQMVTPSASAGGVKEDLLIAKESGNENAIAEESVAETEITSNENAENSEAKKEEIVVKSIAQNAMKITPQNPELPTVNGPKKPPYTTFRGPWIGIHFTMQNPENPVAMDSGRQQAGFNLQFMSRNLISQSDFGGYLGGDFGTMFYGRGKSYGVVLNNTALDSGFTRLSMHSFDFLVRGHFEYARFVLKPYVNAFAGPRIYATSQYVEAYHHKQDYENSNNTNASTSASFMYGGAVGARLAVSRHVSLDARIEYMRGTETRMVDLDKSNFEGSLATFNLSKFTLQPAYYQFKFGVLFDIWDSYEEDHPREYQQLNNEVTQENVYYYYDSSTNQYIKVNCRCVEQPAGSDSSSIIESQSNSKARQYPQFYESQPKGSRMGPRVRGGSMSPSYIPGGGSGRGSFPGIKPGGGGGIKIRN